MSRQNVKAMLEIILNYFTYSSLRSSSAVILEFLQRSPRIDIDDVLLFGAVIIKIFNKSHNGALLVVFFRATRNLRLWLFK